MKISKCSFSFRPEGVHMCVFVCVVIVVCVSCAYVCTLVCVYIIMCVWLCVCVPFHVLIFLDSCISHWHAIAPVMPWFFMVLPDCKALASFHLFLWYKKKKTVNKCLGIDRISFHWSVLIIFVLVWEDFEQKWSSTEITRQYEVKTWDLLILTPALP